MFLKTYLTKPFSPTFSLSFRYLFIILTLTSLTHYQQYNLSQDKKSISYFKQYNTILRNELLSNVYTFSNITQYPLQPGVNRPFLSDSGIRARQFLISHFQDAGLTTNIDGAGNVIGIATCPLSLTYKNKSQRKRLLLGSHMDTVPNGGKWDGAYGILASIAIAKILTIRGGPCILPFDYGIIAFDDEEGNNQFGTTNFGARAFAGQLNFPNDIPNLSLFNQQYSKVFSIDSNSISSNINSARNQVPLLAFLELHLEQGPVLESRARPTGAVEAIAGQTRLLVNVFGERGHAGTVPMRSRHDALTSAAEAILIIEQIGRKYSIRSLVTTVGKLQVIPGTSNVISSQVEFSIDIRAPVDADRYAALREIYTRLEEIEKKRQTKIIPKIVHQVDAVAMTSWVTDVIEEVIRERTVKESNIIANGEKTRNSALGVFEGQQAKAAIVKDIGLSTLTSGAGHDTQFMAKITDVGMVFVRCKNGLSHDPDEFVSDDDAYEGAVTLLRVVDKMADKVRKEKQLLV